MVCSATANVLICNRLLQAQFAENPSRINVQLQTTNLGVRSSKSLRARHFFTSRLTGLGPLTIYSHGSPQAACAVNFSLRLYHPSKILRELGRR